MSDDVAPEASESRLNPDGLVRLPPEAAKPGPNLWMVKELAAQLRVSRGMVYTWIAKGEVRTVRTPGGHHRIPADEVKRLLTQGLEDSQDSPLT